MKLFVEIELNRFVALKKIKNFFKSIQKQFVKTLLKSALQSLSRSLLSFVPRRSFKERRLNEPPAGACACVPRRSKKGLTFANGRLC